MTIFDLVKSAELAAYWNELTKDRQPYLGETLFPDDKKLGLDLKWIKGSKGLPIVLKPSAFDAAAVPRPRIGFSTLSTQMPFFKESMYIDEALRQELNMVLETNNQAYIDSVVNRVFNDQIALLEGARARREMMRMMALTTGMISITANGQNYDYDYGLDPVINKATVDVSWADTENAHPVNDIRGWQDKIEDATGVRPTRAVCSRKTWGYLLNNLEIKKNIFAASGGQGQMNDARLNQHLLDELDLRVVVYSKRYADETGATFAYVPDDTFVLFPEGTLGKSWFGTTPEESDLMASQVANVSIVETGVAITTIEKADPVNVETKVTMINLPSFEAADQVHIADVVIADEDDDDDDEGEEE
ncbi:MAG: major capsid protein E [Clostridiales bacterium]|nr:major capsid protein E [Clostridiales bacterium]